MKLISNRHNIFLTTLLFILTFVGYQFSTTFLLPISSDVENASRMVTVPYRIIELLLSIIVIFANISNKIKKNDIITMLLLLFFIFYFTRITYELYFDEHSTIRDYFRETVINYTYLIISPAVIAIYLGYNKIDLNKAVIWIYSAMAICSVIILINNNMVMSSEITSRLDANLGMNSIGYGQFSVSTILMSIFFFLRSEKVVYKIVHILICIISFIALVLAGSRGPIFSLFSVGLFWLFSKSKNYVLGLLIVILCLCLMYVYSDQILNLIGDISPVMQKRIMASIYENDLSGREIYYKNAIDIFTNNPFIGNQLVTNYGVYTHNFILDILMALGLLGFIPFIIVFISLFYKSYILIRQDNRHYWVCILLIQQFTYLMSSSALYLNQLACVLMVFLILRYKSLIKLN